MGPLIQGYAVDTAGVMYEQLPVSSPTELGVRFLETGFFCAVSFQWHLGANEETDVERPEHWEAPHY